MPEDSSPPSNEAKRSRVNLGAQLPGTTHVTWKPREQTEGSGESGPPQEESRAQEATPSDQQPETPSAHW